MAHLNCYITCTVAFCIAACIIAVVSEKSTIESLPFCGDKRHNNQKLVFVSTLDGRLSALDIADRGSVSWSIDTGPGPMLSSSIHNLELTNNGQMVRMIPSLSGGIYKFNGTTIEPIPVSADLLLTSTPFTYSSDLAMSGGKETRTYGLVAKTGEIVYECTIDGCSNATDKFASDDIIVVQRRTQTVRAIEARTGIERWNFSVGQHDLNLVLEGDGDCHGGNTPTRLPEDYVLKVIVPEGLVCAVSKNTGEIVWKQKFGAPVVAAWELVQGMMYPVDLFSSAQWSPQLDDELGSMTPSLYIGMHKKQLYIQESVTLHEQINKMSYELMQIAQPNVPQIHWAPVPATALANVESIEASESTDIEHTELSVTIGTSLLYASPYANDNGYYLFNTHDLKCSAGDKANGTSLEDDDNEEDDHVSEVYIMDTVEYTLWHYWKEIVLISFSTAIALNLLYYQKFFGAVNLLPFTKNEVMNQEIIVVEKPVPMLPEPDHVHAHRSISEQSSQSLNGFTSRYLTDFHPVHCLGRGGFGVVFEARNKIDDCHYAIKRIPLPNRQESRERVMREVKALAKLDHHNIVRYFNAWLECPPPGWQEEQDKLVPNCDMLASHGEPMSAAHTGQTLSLPSSPEKCKSTILNLGTESESDDLLKSKQIPTYTSDRSDSFIVFEDSDGKEKELTINDDDCEDEDSGTNMTESVNTNNSERCLSAWGVETKRKRGTSITECHERKKKIGHRRPLSLDLSSDGKVLLPKISRMYLFIQMQLCQRESLREWLCDNFSNRDMTVVLRMFEQIVQAVEYVHLQGLIHRDLKPSNIFFSMTGEIKVGDFGLVTAMVENTAGQRTPSPDVNPLFIDARHTARVGTQLYMSPEQALGLPYNYKVDIYSLGIILFELLVPFKTGMERSCTLTNLRNNKFPKNFQDDFKQEYELLQMMLSHSPGKRPTTYGIRARPPLNQFSTPNTNEEWHFELPSLQKQLRKGSSISNSSSSESWENI